MTKDRWLDLKDKIKDKFGIEDQKVEKLEKGEGKREIIEFSGPLGKMKIECIIRPKVLEKKVHYTHRQGATAEVEYITSNSEKTYKIGVHRWDTAGQEWEEIRASNLENLAQ